MNQAAIPPASNLMGPEPKESAKAVGKTIGKLALKGSVRVLSAGALKLGDFNEANEEIADELSNMTEAELDALIDRRLDNAHLADQTFEKFRKSLNELANTPATEDAESKPLLFIVDELDRCRPDYALSVLETIKHFFSVPNVHFLLVCDVEQLVAAVQHRYGIEGHGYTYLEKFIDVRASFPTLGKSEQETALNLFLTQNKNQLPDDLQEGRSWVEFRKFIIKNSIKNRYSLRKIEKITGQFSIVMHFLDTNKARIDPLIYLLCDLKISHPKLFEKAKNGKLSFSEIDETYELNTEHKKGFRNLVQFIFGDKPDDDSAFDLSQFSFTYNLNTAEEIREYLINDVIERIAT